MAHVQMHQAHGDPNLLEPIYDRLKQKRELENRSSIARIQAGVQMYNKQKELDYAMEQTKLHESNQFRIARMNAGINLQLKQMGIDLETTLQKMRNFNVMEKAEFERVTAEIIERMKNKNAQAQILKKYQTELKLANYNAKQALYRTFIDTFGDIMRNGDPASNAIDSAVYTLWIAGFRLIEEQFNMRGSTDKDYDASKLSSDVEGAIDLEGGSNVKADKQYEAEIAKLISDLKKAAGVKEGGPRKIIQNAKPKYKTYLRMQENILRNNVEAR